MALFFLLFIMLSPLLAAEQPSPDCPEKILQATAMVADLRPFNWGVRSLSPRTQANIRFNPVIWVKFVSALSTRQYAQYNIVDPLPLWPLQQRPTLNGGDALNQPILDTLTLFPRLGVQAQAETPNCSITAEISGRFGSVAFAGGVFAVETANFNISRGNHTLRFGQWEHPLFLENVRPDEVSLKGSVPIAPQSGLTPQVAYTYSPYENLRLKLTAYTGYIVTDVGPTDTTGTEKSFSSEFQRRSGMPGWNFNVEAGTEENLLGGSFNLHQLVPRLITEYTPPLLGAQSIVSLASEDRVTSKTYSVYAKVKPAANSNLKAQVLFGDNGVEIYTLGGYGVSSFNEGRRTYTNIRFASVWGEYTWQTPLPNLEFGLTGGYARTLGSHKDLVLINLGDTAEYETYTLKTAASRTLAPSLSETSILGRPLQNMGWIWRIAPRVWMKFNEHYRIGVELSYCKALFGNFNNKGKITEATNIVDMLRAAIGASYVF